jgi:hypothetical protein
VRKTIVLVQPGIHPRARLKTVASIRDTACSSVKCWRPTSDREFVIPANGLSANPTVESKLPRNQLAQHSLSRLFKVQ